jgi:SAM-dependent methyltransferase
MSWFKISPELEEKIRRDIKQFADLVGIDADSLYNRTITPERKFQIFIFPDFKNLLLQIYGNEDNLKKLKYLDFGCGYGLNLLHGLKKGYNVIGIEPYRYDRAIELLKINGIKNPQEKILPLKGEDMLGLPDNYFDVIYSIQVLEHVKDIKNVLTELKNVLTELKRILNKERGIIFLTIPNYNSIYEGHYEIFWIPYLNKKLARLYLKFIGRNPEYLDDLNFTTPEKILKFSKEIFGNNYQIYIDVWGVRNIIPLTGIFSKKYLKLLDQNKTLKYIFKPFEYL